MPNNKSAEKRIRQNEKCRLLNSARKSRVKTLEKRFRTAVAAGKKDEAAALLPAVSSAYDKAAKGGVVHKNKVARKKQQFARAIQSLEA